MLGRRDRNYGASQWFLGEHLLPGNVPHWQGIIDKTDLGISVEHNGHIIFYMGDTTGNPAREGCDSNALCNDAIVMSDDTIAIDGIDATPYLSTDDIIPYAYRPQIISGIHDEYPFDPSYFYDPIAHHWQVDPQYTVPTGAISTNIVYRVEGPTDIFITIPTVILWYTTASNPSVLDYSNSRSQPKLWAACSISGYKFINCYPDNVPFSNVSTINLKSKFIQVSAVNISYEHFTDMCGPGGYNTTSGLCLLFNSGTARIEGGLLIFGNGTFYRDSDSYLAYINNADIGRLRPGDIPMIYYWGMDGWSTSENDAYGIMGKDLPEVCESGIERDLCNDELDKLIYEGIWPYIFGEMSIKLIPVISESQSEPILLILSNHRNTDGYLDIYYRFAYLSEPTEWTLPIDTNTNGYGPYIIDRFIGYNNESSELLLSYTISKWTGGVGRYGIYTNNMNIPWPPEI